MDSLSRSALREHIFKIVFASGFRNSENPDNYIPLYFDCLTDDTGTDIELVQKDAQYISDKSKQIILKCDETDKIISENAKGWSFSRLGKAELALLRLSLFEILFDDAIPQNVAINEAVELAKVYANEQSPGFINGILATVIGKDKDE